MNRTVKQMNYYEFSLKVSVVASNEESAEKLISEALMLNDIDLENIRCEFEEKYSQVVRQVNIINIVNIEDDDPTVVRSYTEEAFLDMCNDKLYTNYTLEELPKAERVFLDKYKYLELHTTKLITEYEKRGK